jgi:hypothetical protein
MATYRETTGRSLHKGVDLNDSEPPTAATKDNFLGANDALDDVPIEWNETGSREPGRVDGFLE